MYALHMMNVVSWYIDVKVDGNWSTDTMRNATEAEAVAAAHELLTRWFLPTDSRANTSTLPVNVVFNFKKNRDSLLVVATTV